MGRAPSFADTQCGQAQQRPGSNRLLLWFPNRNFRGLLQFIVRNKNDAHSPTSVGAEHPAEILPREFLIVHVDYRQRTIFPSTVIDYASQHVAPRRPLVYGLRVVLDLGTTGGNLNGDVFAEFVAISNHGGNGLIVEEQNIFVGHLLYLRTDS